MNTTYSDRIKNNTVISCWIIFGILILVHGFEAIVLRMDETIVGENFINKVFGILVMFAVLRILKWKGADIGFAGTGLFKGLGTGLVSSSCAFSLTSSTWLWRRGPSGDSFIISHPFFNNCIATNLLHVVTESGTDEMMIIRVAIAQLLSFAVVLILWKRR